ncbi:hypothetical protein BC833DRAFT_614856 [Globomyces pollinis-pini]|nr:hypothetical protein BC833DRAFT_614856 [Globomyces pollinis-pini]
MSPLKRHVQTEINKIKRGAVVQINGKLLVVQSSQMKTQGRGGAHYKLEMKDIKSGAKALERVNSGNTLEVVELTSKIYSFLYADDQLHLIDPETFEEITLDTSMIQADHPNKVIPFLTSEMDIKVEFHDTTPISIHVPERATFKVIEVGLPRKEGTESKGTLFKSATLDNNQEIQVPEFVKVDDTVMVNIHSMAYHSRV